MRADTISAHVCSTRVLFGGSVMLAGGGMDVRSYRRRLRIWETNNGRSAGWTIERQGEPIALLTDSRMIDMFWDSYRIEIVTPDPDLRQRMQTAAFWATAESEGLIWRSLEFGEVATDAFPALSPFPEPGRLAIRGLYFPIGDPWPWDRFVLWLRKRTT